MNTTIIKVHCSKCEKSINILTESAYLDISGNEICQDCWNEYMNTTIFKVHCSKCEKSINILTESAYLDISGNEICQDCWNEYISSQLSNQVYYNVKTKKK